MIEKKIILKSYVPGKDTRVEVGGTANAKADNTDLGVYKLVLADQHIPPDLSPELDDHSREQ